MGLFKIQVEMAIVLLTVDTVLYRFFIIVFWSALWFVIFFLFAEESSMSDRKPI